MRDGITAAYLLCRIRVVRLDEGGRPEELLDLRGPMAPVRTRKSALLLEARLKGANAVLHADVENLIVDGADLGGEQILCANLPPPQLEGKLKITMSLVSNQPDVLRPGDVRRTLLDEGNEDLKRSASKGQNLARTAAA